MVYALIDRRVNEKMKERLMKEGFGLIELPPSADLPTPIASHPDSVLSKIGNSIILSCDYCDDGAYALTDIREYAPHIKIHLAWDGMGKEYPSDARFNSLKIGRYLFARRDSISGMITEKATEHGLNIVDVKQGYPHCSVLALGDDAAITADEGMASAMEGVGIKVYRIKPGYITLEPYKYGFIGGACGVFGKKIYFFGDYRMHPSRRVLEEAAGDLGYTLIPLSEGELADFGGIVFLDKQTDYSGNDGCKK